MDTQNLIKDLKALPEVNLKLLQLARESVKKRGGFDHERLKYRYKEVGEASQEAEAYAKDASTMGNFIIELMEE